ncbi:MAG: haloacid dehalogenase type II [Candidatus Accumulibacter phosphatis]|uniref:(S)-2-haloacid dehalogenase n=2 Tax=Candidatus Accumulibacter TaxID=327159 RepID=A0A7D5NHJ3_9PROT|nr:MULTISPECIES: haloacid dehalogenase type II [Candidatus Accumulibacter]QLH52149.1 MAG: haloacid dehalogenase type II [Candidatus Accumulibacter cognatus]MBL8402096.1 haloacid dehalogenase type II [Accumulibacter sp.]MBN8517785.1 haloacid dehalogenase type II [Accumulibacter sp.]MBO3711039.1 haloacid dehalogenase type II [Accumulibacter sp.]MCC2867939.1 haloacid dehalogenase type II [Candidatus Accumulibacter phosphatis]
MSTQHLDGIKACVFDAYGTLFDFNSAALAASDEIGENWQRLSELWRQKQLQYTWLRGLASRHADFWQVTGEALDFALNTLGIDRPGLRERLMDLYLHLGCYPEVPETLHRLQAEGMRLAILSNGTPAMLAAVVHHSGLENVFDAVLSVEEVGVFKPHPAVYALACERLQLAPTAICFLSSNAWDAYSAKASGLRVLWCNRFGQVRERIPETPDGEIKDLSALPDAVSSPVCGREAMGESPTRL